MKTKQLLAFLAAAAACALLSYGIGLVFSRIGQVVALFIIAVIGGWIAAWLTNDRIAEKQYGIAMTFGCIAGTLVGLAL